MIVSKEGKARFAIGRACRHRKRTAVATVHVDPFAPLSTQPLRRQASMDGVRLTRHGQGMPRLVREKGKNIHLDF
ncbi:hypothetical protein EBZ80_14720 [bacterium]|nr:hypothetical protein [bacterium]